MGTEVIISGLDDRFIKISKEYDKLKLETYITGEEENIFEVEIPLEKIKIFITAIKEIEKELKQDKRDLYNNE